MSKFWVLDPPNALPCQNHLRWIEAGKVPALIEFFNAKDLGTSPEPIITTSAGIRSNVEVLGPRSAERPALSEPPAVAGGLTQPVRSFEQPIADIQPPA